MDVPHEFDIENNFITTIIDRNFGSHDAIEMPDFLFFSYCGTEHYKYDNCVKVFFANEVVVPDFNQCDYAIGREELNFGERYCQCNEIEVNEKLESFIVRIIKKGNVPYEKDALGLAKKMSIPDLSSKELVERLIWKVKYHLRKKK